jgi:type IV pilus assembly protein PilP
VALLSLIVLAGCSIVDDPNDLSQYVRETQAKPVGKIKPLPAFKPYESFLYSATSLRTPFRPFVEVDLAEGDGDNGLLPDMARSKQPLEAIELENLHMVGTLHMLDHGRLSALIKDPEGVIHRVKQGDYLGRNFGIIVEITERQLDLVEIVSNGRGGWMKRPRNIVLPVQEL